MKSVDKAPWLAFVLLLWLPGTSPAGEWKSIDGVVSVSTPDPDRFVKSRPIPNSNIVAGWESKDGLITLFVTESPSAASIKLTLNDLEYPFVSEINSKWKKGKLLSSSVKKSEGNQFFTMTAQGDDESTTNYFTQTVTHIGATKYIAAAVGRGTDTRTDPDVKAFMGSFKALVIAPEITEISHQNDHPQVGKDPDENWVPKLMGSIAAFCVIGAIIAFVIKIVTGQNSKVNKSSRRRRREYDDDEEDEEEDRPRSRRRDDDDDRPRSRRRDDEDDEEEDRPMKRRKRDDDDEDEDRPRRRRRDRD